MSGNFFSLVQDHARKRPEAAAIIHALGAGKSVTTSYGELAAMAGEFAAYFSRRVREGAIVPLMLGKSSHCVAAMVGALGAGRAFACLNRKLRGPQVKSVLGQIRPELVLCDLPGLMAIEPGDSARWCIVREGQVLPQQQQIIERMREGSAVEFWPVERKGEAVELPQAGDDPSRVGCCLFTSGSTGTPKGVVVSAKDLLERAWAEVECFGLSERDTLLNILPFSFDVGLNQLLSALAVGCSVVLLDSFLPADILRVAMQERVSGISAVPAIWADMMGAGMKFETKNAHGWLRYITVSGGDLTLDQLKGLGSMAPTVDVFKTYGQTETFRSTVLRPDEFMSKRQSVGRPFGGARVYVVREDQTRCAAGEEGEIVHTGLGTMMGYLDGADAQNKLRPNPFRGADDPAAWAVFTGDLGHVDEDGFLFLSGRRDAMLKISGNRVYPAEIAGQLLALEGVRDAQVVGVKGEDGQVRLVAFVAAPAEMDVTVTRRLLAGRVPSYMVPQQIVCLPALPRTASGKADVPALVERAKELLSGDSNAIHA